MATKKSSRAVLVGAGSVKWLEEQAAAFQLPNAGKAFRCCVNWACQTAQNLDEALGTDASESISVSATAGQWAWLDKYQKSNASARLLSLARAASSKDIFEVLRCKSRTSAKVGRGV